MPNSYVVDTHTLIWNLEGNPRLGENAKSVMADPNSRLISPIIALAEACWIVERGKTYPRYRLFQGHTFRCIQ